MAEATLKI